MIRVAIGDARAIVREGMRCILEETTDIRVVANAPDADTLLETLSGLPVELLVVGSGLPGPGLSSLLHRVERLRPGLARLVLVDDSDSGAVFDALAMGTGGFVSKRCTGDELREAERRVVAGRRYVAPDVAELVVEGAGESRWQPAHRELSPRELEVMSRIGHGERVAEIAAALRISPKTVHTYRGRMMRKMAFRHSADIIRYTAKHGL